LHFGANVKLKSAIEAKSGVWKRQGLSQARRYVTFDG